MWVGKNVVHYDVSALRPLQGQQCCQRSMQNLKTKPAKPFSTQITLDFLDAIIITKEFMIVSFWYLYEKRNVSLALFIVCLCKWITSK